MLKSKLWLLAIFLATSSIANASDIPPHKLALIQKAMDVMHLRSMMDGFIGQIVNVKVARIQNDNPAVSDTELSLVHNVIAEVYNENLDGDGGLYPQLYQVVDKYLSEDDLKFVMNYKGSDEGQRYAKVAPQVIADASDVEKQWNDKLEPMIEQRLANQFPDLKLQSMQ